MHVIHRRNAKQIAQLLKDMRQQVKCSICLNIYKNPIKLKQCRHIYCEKCYNKLLKHSTSTNSIKCPLCKMSARKRDSYYVTKLNDFADYVRKLSEYIIEDQNVNSSTDSPDSQHNKSGRNMGYTPLSVKKKTSLRKTRSLDSISQQKKKDNKRFSLGNVPSSDEEILIDEFKSQITQNNINNIDNRQVIDLLEEECLANLENEFLINNHENSKNVARDELLKKQEASTSKDGGVKTRNTKTKVNTSISSESGWMRMKSTKKKVEPKTRVLKQLNISTSSNNPKTYGTRSAQKSKKYVNTTVNKSKKPEQTTASPKSYKLDQFEAYLQENLVEKSKSPNKNKSKRSSKRNNLTTEIKSNEQNKEDKKTNRATKRFSKDFTEKSSPKVQKRQSSAEESVLDEKNVTNKTANDRSGGSSKLFNFNRRGRKSKQLNLELKSEEENKVSNKISKPSDEDFERNLIEVSLKHNKETSINEELNKLDEQNQTQKVEEVNNDNKNIGFDQIYKPVSNIPNNKEEFEENIFDMPTQVLKLNLIDKPRNNDVKHNNPKINDSFALCTQIIEIQDDNSQHSKEKCTEIPNIIENTELTENLNSKINKISPKISKDIISNTDSDEINNIFPKKNIKTYSRMENKLGNNIQNVILEEKNSPDNVKNVSQNTEERIFNKFLQFSEKLDAKERANQNEEKNTINKKCLDYLTTIQNDIISKNDLVKELSILLSNTKSIFSTVLQDKNNQISDSKEILPLPNMEADFTDKALPYVEKLDKLYSDFKHIISDITENTKNLTEVLNLNSDIITSLLAGKKSDTLPTTITVTSDILSACNIKKLRDTEAQTDLNIICPKCKNEFNVKENSNIEKSTDCMDIDLSISKHLVENNEVRNISLIKNDSFKNINTDDKKVNRRLEFNEQNYKRIRQLSSDSESENDIKQKNKIQKIIDIYDKDDLEISSLFDKNTPTQEQKDICKSIIIEKKQEFGQKNVTQEVTTKYTSLLEREYKELYNIEIKSPDSKNNAENNGPSLDKRSNFSIEKMFETSMSEPFSESKSSSKKESQFSKSLFTETERTTKKSYKDISFEKIENSILSPKNVTQKHKFSESLFTEADKTVCPQADKGLNKSTISQKSTDLFEVEENMIVEDSLDGDENIFRDINIVESTPLKDQRGVKKSNLDDFVNCLNEEASHLNFENTEWTRFIAPPPEFQDTEKIQNPLTEKNSEDIISLTLSNDTVSKKLNERISKIDDSYFDEKKNLNENKLHKTLNNTLLDESLNKNISRKNSFRQKTKQDEQSTSSLYQKENIVPLQIVKTTNYIPKTFIQTTPKQTSMFNYLTPNKNDSIASSKSICLTPRIKNTANQSFSSNMEITPIKEHSDGPSSGIKKLPISITCTRLNKEETTTVVSLTNKFNLLYIKQFNNQVTHLVVLVDEKNRVRDHTMKYVSAVARGLWVVSYKWAQECFTRNTLLPEEPYEVLDVSGLPGPKRSRLTRKTNPLLKNFAFYCAEPFLSVTKPDLEGVITALGGEVIPTLNSLTRVKGKVCLILTEAKISQDFEQYQIWLDTLKIITVDIEWLSRTVGQYQICSIRPFMLCLDEGIESYGYPPSLIVPVPDSLTENTEAYTANQ